jgi:hypothetical protein
MRGLCGKRLEIDERGDAHAGDGREVGRGPQQIPGFGIERRFGQPHEPRLDDIGIDRAPRNFGQNRATRNVDIGVEHERDGIALGGNGTIAVHGGDAAKRGAEPRSRIDNAFADADPAI